MGRTISWSAYVALVAAMTWGGLLWAEGTAHLYAALALVILGLSGAFLATIALCLFPRRVS